MFLLEHYNWYINVYLHVRNTKCIKRPAFYIAYDNYIDFFLHRDIDVYYFQKAFFLNKSHWINSSLQKKQYIKIMLSYTEEKEKLPLATFLNLYFWMMFFYTCLSSHLHACESGLSQKSMILQHFKCSVRKASRPVCLFIYATENF